MRWHWLFFLLVLVSGCTLGAGAGAPVPGYLVYVHDREGTVLAAIDDRGKTVSTSNDDGFGLRLSSTGTPVPRDFLDQDLDEETGYLHFRHRYYDPATAQWISPDPKLLTDPDCSASVPSCNPYALAGNRPLEWVDLDGRSYERLVDSHGVVTLTFTLGFTGPDAEVARQLFTNSIGSGTGTVKVVALTGVYKSEAEIPAGFSHVVADHTLTDAHGKAATATTTLSSSTITLGSVALVGNGGKTLDVRSAVIDHEVLHLAGLLDGYDPKSSESWPGHEDGYMGAVRFDTIRGGNAHLTPLELHYLLAVQPKDVNQGIVQSPGASDPNAGLQVAEGNM